jgi:hypothetical protein
MYVDEDVVHALRQKAYLHVSSLPTQHHSTRVSHTLINDGRNGCEANGVKLREGLEKSNDEVVREISM